MKKSLGQYNIEQSSTADIKNIRWTKIRENITPKPKRRTKKIPPPTLVPKKTRSKKPVKTEFKIKETKSVKQKDPGKQFQNASKSNGLIKAGFKRPGR